jgi:hypothetical protein
MADRLNEKKHSAIDPWHRSPRYYLPGSWVRTENSLARDAEKQSVNAQLLLES